MNDDAPESRVEGRLADRVAIVVGAGSTPGETVGNGRATAILFARAGASVLLVDRDADRAEETRAEIEAEGGTAAVEAADITREADCEGLVAACVERFGRVDVLHNNVGVGSLGGPVELPREQWQWVFDTNVTSMFLACKYVLPHMERQGRGAIINISSLAAIRHTPYPMLAYHASKAAVNAFTEAVALQYAGRGVRVNCIMPGLIDTPMAMVGLSAGLGISTQELRERRNASVPMGKMGSAWDVAHAALFLASEEARYITGVCLPVDGGLALR
jgi:NAD(P)-dependent dehydrogenase (short-subunit alcohol dehydrogenase family)